MKCSKQDFNFLEFEGIKNKTQRNDLINQLEWQLALWAERRW